MQFRGLEIDFDIYEADNAAAFEDAVKNFKAANHDVPGEGLVAAIRRQCGLVFDFFDDIFGEGFHQQIFGERTNLTECLEAFRDFNVLVAGQKKELEALGESIKTLVTPQGNRAERRAANRAAPIEVVRRA